MARIKYTGPVDPMGIPGVGRVGKEFVFCPDAIALEFQGVEGFEVEIEESEARSQESAGKTQNPGPKTLNHKKNGGDAI